MSPAKQPLLIHSVSKYNVQRWVRSPVWWTLSPLFCSLYPHSSVLHALVGHSPRSLVLVWEDKSWGADWEGSQMPTGMEIDRWSCHCTKATNPGCVLWLFLHLESPPLYDHFKNSPNLLLLITSSLLSARLLWLENGCANSWQFSKNDFSWGLGTWPCFFPKEIEVHKSKLL